MTEKDLKDYQKLKEKAFRLQKRIDNVMNVELDEVSGKVKGSSQYFPYSETRYSVPMDEPSQRAKWDKKKERIDKKIREIVPRMDAIEEYIEDLDDVVLIEIFELYYLQGMSQKEIADSMNFDQTTISKRIRNHWEERLHA